MGAWIATLLMLFSGGLVQAAEPGVIRVVAAENFYGDVVSQIGGSRVSVTSILTNPEQDPHLFEASVSTAKAISSAQLVIYNGLGYDAWMQRLLAASANPARKVIQASKLVGRKDGENPHIWYDPAAMLLIAKTVAENLQTLDPQHASEYQERLATFGRAMDEVAQKVKSMRSRFQGVNVTATEPVFAYMSDALGLVMRNESFQMAVMNETEPGASDVIRMEQDIKSRKVAVVLFNKQASSRAASRVKKLALASGVAVVGVTETLPQGMQFQQWMLSQLNEFERALSGSGSQK